ncbi:MAG TPA: ATP-binding protein, partial [Anaeromyxobacteraceae bacterium]|nr:ATP-binding protein [Anaeromyxobacteraceae bacterium]
MTTTSTTTTRMWQAPAMGRWVRPAALLYGMAALGALALALAGHLLRGTFPEVLLIFPLVVTALVTFRLGAGPGVAFGFGVGFAIWWVVLRPSESFALSNHLQLADLVFYALASLLLSVAIALVQRGRQQLEAARADAARTRDRLALAQEIGGIGTFDGNVREGTYAWSPELEALHGFAPGTFPGTYAAWRERLHPEDRAGLDGRIGRAVETGAFEGEWRIVRPDGTVRWVSARGRVFTDGDGTPLRFLGVNIDITDIRRVEQALRESDRRKDEFLAVLSHELRNPLAPVRNAVHILQHASPGGPAARGAVEVIGRQVDHLGRLVDDLLDVTRISRGKVRLHLERVDLAEIVRRTLEDHRALLDARGIGLQVQELAPAPVDGDAVRLAQVVGNLVQNSAKFTERGGRVTVAVTCAGGRARLRVADSGMGIAPEILGRVFEPFTQDDRSLHRTRGGLGLGLALVRGFTSLHGGTVQARSAGVGHGAEFVVDLPAAAPGAALAAPASRAGARADARSRRILLVEDNVDAAETLRIALEIAGHEVAIAHDGRSGVEKARLLRPDIVLCDIGLPEMDGYAVAGSLRADPAMGDTALVALTGYGLARDRARALDAGFD